MTDSNSREARDFRAEHLRRWLKHIGLEVHNALPETLALGLLAADEIWLIRMAAMEEPDTHETTV